MRFLILIIIALMVLALMLLAVFHVWQESRLLWKSNYMVTVAISNILFLVLAFIMWIPARNNILLSALLAILILLGLMSGVSGVAKDGFMVSGLLPTLIDFKDIQQISMMNKQIAPDKTVLVITGQSKRNKRFSFIFKGNSVEVQNFVNKHIADLASIQSHE